MPNQKTSTQFDGFLTVQQAAEQLALPTRTVLWQLQNDHIYGARKFGEGKRGIWLIPQSAIDNYVAPKRGRRPAVNQKGRK
jgi:excisionase family DNA binding protein